jgi:ankyrin repeat protein
LTGFNTARDTFSCIRLHFAINNFDADRVKQLVASGLETNYYFQGFTPLLLSVLRDQPDIAFFLIQSKCDITLPEKTKSARQPIHIAAFMGRIGIVQSLLYGGASVHAADGVLMTPLHWAAYAGRYDVVKYLLTKGAHVNNRDDVGCTALHRAAENGHTAVAKLLIESGSVINAQDLFGWTPLFQAAMCGHKDVVLELIACGSQINVQDTAGHTVPYLVCGRLLPQVLFILSSRNVNVLQRKVLLVTPALSHALHNDAQDELAMLLLLLDMGADVNVTTGEGKLPLRYAAEEGNEKLITVLVNAGTNLDRESWITDDNWPVKLINSPLCLWLKAAASVRVHSLYTLCKLAIRKALQTSINAKVTHLPLPVSIKTTLTF